MEIVIGRIYYYERCDVYGQVVGILSDGLVLFDVDAFGIHAAIDFEPGVYEVVISDLSEIEDL